MKSLKRFGFLLLSFIMIISIVSGCSSNKSQNQEDSSSVPSESIISEEEVGMSDDKGETTISSSSTSPVEPTKVIITLNLDMQTVEFDQSISNLENLISKHEGYIENSNIHLGSYYSQNNYRNAQYTIRIPKINIKSFMDETGSIGKINFQEESKEDVTMHYRDTESRLNVLNIKEERISELLKKAEKMEDIIVLENTLSDIIYEKESLTGVLKSLDNKVEFSTINISLDEVQKLITKDDSKASFGQRISNAMSDSLYNFRLGAENLVIQLVYALPTIIILALLAYGLYRGVRAYTRKKYSNSDKNNQ